jgi:hypothetical protein
MSETNNFAPESVANKQNMKPEPKPRPLYKIEYYDERTQKWVLNFPFQYMQKSFAEGAWSMLKSFYNHTHKYRLVKDGVVVETMTKQTVGVA